jgi:hypothetical protein
MAFLWVNGFKVPVQAESLQHKVDDVGRLGRSQSGALGRERQYLRRMWQASLTPMTYADALALRLLTQRLSANWAYDGETSVGSLPSSAVVATTASNLLYGKSVGDDGIAYPAGAKYGTRSLQVASDTTNLWAGNVATGTDTSSNTAGFTAVTTGAIASSTVAKWQGARSLRLITTGSGQGVQTDGIACSNGQAYTATFRYGGSAVLLTATLKSNGVTLATKTFTPSATAWGLMAISGVASGVTGLQVVITAAGAGTFYFDGFQIEATAFHTPWVAASRGGLAGLLSYEMRAGILGSKRGISVNLWSRETLAANAQYFLLNDDAADLELGLSQTTDSQTLQVQVAYDGTTDTLLSSGVTAWSLNEWRMLTLVVQPGVVAGMPEISLYVNGALNVSSSPGVTLAPELLNKLIVGSGPSGTNRHQGAIDDFTIYPFALTPRWVESLYEYNAATPNRWPLVLAKGDALQEGGVYCHATVDTIPMTDFYEDGSFINGASPSIALVEG